MRLLVDSRTGECGCLRAVEQIGWSINRGSGHLDNQAPLSFN
jgi:hypothetical protein